MPADSETSAELTTADDTRRVFQAMDESAPKVMGLDEAWSHWEGHQGIPPDGKRSPRAAIASAATCC